MIILEWLIWGLLFLFTLLYSVGHYINAVKRGKRFHKATPKIIFMGWFFIFLFIFIDISKLHILWLYPISVFIGMALVLNKAFDKAEKTIIEKKKDNLS